MYRRKKPEAPAPGQINLKREDDAEYPLAGIPGKLEDFESEEVSIVGWPMNDIPYPVRRSAPVSPEEAKALAEAGLNPPPSEQSGGDFFQSMEKTMVNVFRKFFPGKEDPNMLQAAGQVPVPQSPAPAAPPAASPAAPAPEVPAAPAATEPTLADVMRGLSDITAVVGQLASVVAATQAPAPAAPPAVAPAAPAPEAPAAPAAVERGAGQTAPAAQYVVSAGNSSFEPAAPPAPADLERQDSVDFWSKKLKIGTSS